MSAFCRVSLFFEPLGISVFVDERQNSFFRFIGRPVDVLAPGTGNVFTVGLLFVVRSFVLVFILACVTGVVGGIADFLFGVVVIGSRSIFCWNDVSGE